MNRLQVVNLNTHILCYESEKNKEFLDEAINIWDKGGEGSFMDFINHYLFWRWFYLAKWN